jgi:hypothetical protein
MSQDILDREPVSTSVSQPTQEVTVGRPPKQETISALRYELEAMKATIKLLEEGGVKKLPMVRDRVARITFYEDKIVTNVGKVWMERKFGEVNKREEDRAYVSITTEDGKIHKIDYLDFLNESVRIICPIKKIDRKDASVVHGTFQSQNLNPVNPLGENQYKNFQSEEMEDVERKTDDYYVLEITKGQRKGEKVTLNYLALNI